MNRREKPNDDRIYSAEEREFMNAVDAFKREMRRPFPTLSEVLAVALSLGYRKVVESKERQALCRMCGSAIPQSALPVTIPDDDDDPDDTPVFEE